MAEEERPNKWPGLVNKDDPDFHNPQFQRRILRVRRPIFFVENIHEVLLGCGHEPLLLGGESEPQTGTYVFCGDCRDAVRQSRGSKE